MQSEPISNALVPPRLLAGVSVLYWGAMTGEAFIALIIAVLLEGKNWVKFSWDFDDSAYVKAFQVSLGLLGLVLLLVWLDEINRNSLYEVIKWFPLCLLPVELAQRYGNNDRVNLNTFFYFSRQRMRQDLREGRETSPNKINTGYPYIFIVIIVASCSSRMDVLVHVAMLALITAIITAISIKRGLGWKRLAWTLPIMLIVSVWFQSETAAIYKSYVERGSAFKEPSGGESNPHRSQLGQLGDIKQSQEIQWRMWGDDVPKYLRLNSYNKHHGVIWSYDYKSDRLNDFDDMEDAFENRGGIEFGGDDSGLYVFEAGHEEIFQDQEVAKKSLTLRGKGQSDTKESIVPAVEGMVAIGEMAGGNVIPAVHPLGVLKLVNRKANIDYQIWSVDENILDSSPDGILDLEIHKSCVNAVKDLSREMKLSTHASSAEKVEAIRNFFIEEFTYALHFEMPKINYDNSHILHFMREGRKGHCEYFATTAALLLREQGIPARYCIGYVARERDADTWIMRGTHAHAWCSAWIDGKWQIVDLTPPDWLSLQIENKEDAFIQGFKDWFQNLNQDFSIWRSDKDNKSLLDLIVWVLGIMLLLWFSYRMFKVRVKQPMRDNAIPAYLSYRGSEELAMLESKLSDLIGKRSQSQTYRSWISDAREKLDDGVFIKLNDLLILHEQSRYGGMNRSEEMLNTSLYLQTILK